MEEDEVVTILAALAQPNRLQIFRMLVVAGESGMTPGMLGQTLEVPAATLSFHLKELTHAGLIEPQRVGRHLVYRAQYARMNQVLAYLTANCCQGVPCLEQSSMACPC